MFHHVGFVLAIDMLADQVHLAGTFGQHGFGPVPHRADTDELNGGIHFPHGLSHALVFLHVFAERHVPQLPVSVHFISDRPPLHPVSRGMAVARAQEMQALVQENRAKVVLAEAEVPLAMAEAFRKGNLGIMDYYKMKNIVADTTMRDSIAKPPKKEE